MKIECTAKFLKQYKRLPNNIKLLVEKKEEKIKSDIFHPSLKTHKLLGKLNDFYSFSISYEYRIVFHVENNAIILNAVGTHAVYK